MIMNAFISENDKKIFEEELGPRLPQRIFDAHVHIFDMSCYPKGKTFGPKDYRTWLNGEISQAT